MQNWKSIDEALDFAIENEKEAAQFYLELAEKASQPWMREVFEGFAREEQGHQRKLEGIKSDGRFKPSGKKVTDLKIADYLVDVKPSPNMDYQKALILAMKREKAAFRLYSDLAEQSADAELKDAFLALAQEEAKHKLRFEVEYDDMLAEN